MEDCGSPGQRGAFPSEAPVLPHCTDGGTKAAPVAQKATAPRREEEEEEEVEGDEEDAEEEDEGE